MNTLYFFDPNGEIILNITGRIRVMCKLDVIVKTIFFFGKTKTQMPVQSFLFPVFIPFFLCSGTNKELHFHLFKLTHPENELPCYDFIPESFTDLCNAERNLHPPGLLYIQKIDEYALGCFGSQVNLIILIIR